MNRLHLPVRSLENHPNMSPFTPMPTHPLWEYFQLVINWVSSTFTITRSKFMKGVDWGSLFNDFRDANLDADEIEQETARLVLDDDVQRKPGIYPYILTREEKHLNIRAFSNSMKQKVYEKQAGLCVRCTDEFTIREMEADHMCNCCIVWYFHYFDSRGVYVFQLTLSEQELDDLKYKKRKWNDYNG